MKQYSVIVGDNDIELRDFYKEILAEKGLKVGTATTGVELLRMYKEAPADLVIMDTLDSEMNRTLKYSDVFNILKYMNPDVKILFISGLDVDKEEFENFHKGVTLLGKPLSQEAILKAVSIFLKEV